MRNGLVNHKFVSGVFLLGGLLLLGACASASDSSPGDTAVEALSNRSYYVDIRRGNDAGDGSLARPWKTIKKASNAVQAGDTVFIRAGDYRAEGIIVIQKQGTEQAPIKFLPYEQEKPVVAGFTIRNSQWIEIRNFSIIGPKTLPANWREMPEIVTDDPSVGAIDPTQPWLPVRKSLVFRKYGTYSNLIDNWINNWTAGVSIEASHYISISNNEISHHSAGVSATNGSTKSIVRGNRLHHLMQGVYSWHGPDYEYSLKESVISNNYIFQNLAFGIRIINDAQSNLIEDNVVEFTGITHIDTHSGSSSNLIKNNQLTYGGYYSEAMEYPGASGISIHSSGPGNLVEGNYVAYQYDVTLRDGHGVIVDLSPPGATIVNNVIYRNMGNGVASTGSGNNVIIHNTIVENGYNTPSKWGVGIGMAQPQDINNVIANNILANNSGGGMYFGGLLSQQKYVDYNLIYSPSGAPLVGDNWDKAQAFYDLAAYQTTGFGLNSILAEPKFVDVNRGNFHLRPDSLAIDAGTSEYTFPLDKDNRSRPFNGKSDIGAFEYYP